MIRRSSVLLLLLLLGNAAIAQVHRLRDIHTIYVDQLGSSDDAGLQREKLINKLVKSNRLSVVDSPEAADVVLTGASATRERFVQGTSHRKTKMAIKLVSQDKQILWTLETESGHWRWSDDAFEKVPKELLKAIEKDEKSKE
jgi:hypothetical protein